MSGLIEVTIPERPSPRTGTICAGDPDCLFDTYGTITGVVAAAGWPAASTAILCPFVVRSPCVVTNIAWWNGTPSGNVDAGVYDMAGNLLVSVGGVAQTGANAIQSADVTDTPLKAGTYFMALVIDNTTGQNLKVAATAPWLRASGVVEVASAYPLPSGPVTMSPPSAAFGPWLAVGLTGLL